MVLLKHQRVESILTCLWRKSRVKRLQSEQRIENRQKRDHHFFVRYQFTRRSSPGWRLHLIYGLQGLLLSSSLRMSRAVIHCDSRMQEDAQVFYPIQWWSLSTLHQPNRLSRQWEQQPFVLGKLFLSAVQVALDMYGQQAQQRNKFQLVKRAATRSSCEMRLDARALYPMSQWWRLIRAVPPTIHVLLWFKVKRLRCRLTGAQPSAW